MATTATGNTKTAARGWRKPKRKTNSSTTGAHTKAWNHGILLKSRRCSAPPANAAAKAIGPKTKILSAHKKPAHCNMRPHGKGVSQSATHPEPCRAAGKRGAKLG